LARISGIEIIETRARGTALPTGFYSGGPALADRCKGNNFLNQKRLFRPGQGTANLTNPDWFIQGRSRAGRLARLGPPL